MSAVWLQTSAVEALAAIRRGEVTAADLMRQTLAAIAAYDPKILALTSLIDEPIAVTAAVRAATTAATRPRSRLLPACRAASARGQPCPSRT